MTQGVFSVTLHRDGNLTPWGFRLHGGKDIGYPLVIQRVFLGSPSEGELQRGDVILQIQERDTSNMTHKGAHDLIKSAGTQLRLLIHRLPGAPQSPGVYTPTSPIPSSTNIHPYAKLLREQSSQTTRAPMFQPMSPPKPTTPRPVTPPVKEYCYSPLPTTPVYNHYHGGFFAPTPKTLADVEIEEYRREKMKEKAAITHQGYRSIPLIAPKPKTRHDVPMGSYLRHYQDPNWKGRYNPEPAKPVFFTNLPTPTYLKTQHQIASPKRPTRAPAIFERPIDDSSQLVHHQYNSPLFLYSQRNVDETIREQTGYNPSKTKFSPAATGPLSPGAQAGGGTLAPARAGTKLTNIVDITLSPTFQMIHEEEKRTSSPGSDSTTPPPMRRSPGGGPRPFVGFEQDRINAFGASKENIHQSGSFKTLMTALAMSGAPEA